MREKAEMQIKLVMLRALAKDRIMMMPRKQVVHFAAIRTGGLVVLGRRNRWEDGQNK